MENKSRNYWKEIYPLWREELSEWFGGVKMKPFITYTLIAILVLSILLIINQEALFMDEVVLRVIAGASTFLILLILVPVSFISANIKLYSRKQEELSKHNWDKVDFSESPYDVWKEGYAIKIHNNKVFDFGGLRVQLAGIEINGKPRPKPKKAYYFHHADRENYSLSFLEDDGLEHGKSKKYAITQMVKNRKGSVCKLLTSQDEDDYTGYLFRSKSGKVLENKVVITLEIRGYLSVEKETYTLPARYLKYEIMSDGRIERTQNDQT